MGLTGKVAIVSGAGRGIDRPRSVAGSTSVALINGPLPAPVAQSVGEGGKPYELALASTEEYCFSVMK